MALLKRGRGGNGNQLQIAAPSQYPKLGDSKQSADCDRMMA